MFYLISYDIPSEDSYRWRKLHTLLKKYGHWVQLSLFQIEGNDSKMAMIQKEINKIIDFEVDRVLIIPLCLDCRSKITSVGEYQIVEKQDFYFF